ncbi:MAG: hypothetical protein IPN21_10820 [Burkholderiales bacterium]|nr:hypothetical protein [Burkholderiales bacterium]
MDALRAGLADLGVVSDAADVEGLQAFHFCADPLVLIGPRDWAMAGRGALSLTEVVAEPFVGLREGSALQALLTRQLGRLGQRLHCRVRVDSLDAVCRMVGLGVGIGVLPRAVAARHAGASKLRRVRLSDAWARRDLLLCVRDVDGLPTHARQLPAALLAPASCGS